MSKIILQPSGNKDAIAHYSDTILNPVSLDILKKYIDKEDYENLVQIYPSGKAMVWGVTPSGNNITKWNKIERGDITLFSSAGAIFSSGVTTYKLHSKSLAEYLCKYDNKNRLIEIEEWEWKDNSGDNERNVKINYAEYESLIKSKTTQLINKFENELTEEKFDYDDNGNIVNYVRTVNSKEYNNKKWIYEFDDNFNWISATEFEKNKPILITKRTFEK